MQKALTSPATTLFDEVPHFHRKSKGAKRLDGLKNEDEDNPDLIWSHDLQHQPERRPLPILSANVIGLAVRLHPLISHTVRTISDMQTTNGCPMTPTSPTTYAG